MPFMVSFRAPNGHRMLLLRPKAYKATLVVSAAVATRFPDRATAGQAIQELSRTPGNFWVPEVLETGELINVGDFEMEADR